MGTTLQKMGELIIQAYLDGKINQQEQSDMIDIINHISLKDFVK